MTSSARARIAGGIKAERVRGVEVDDKLEFGRAGSAPLFMAAFSGRHRPRRRPLLLKSRTAAPTPGSEAEVAEEAELEKLDP